MKPRPTKKISIASHIKKFNQILKHKGKSSKKISILPQIKKFKENIIKKKHEIKTRQASENLPQKPQKRKIILPLPQPKKKKVVDSTILLNKMINW